MNAGSRAAGTPSGIVTTGRRADEARACTLAAAHGLAYIARDGMSIAEIRRRAGIGPLEAVIVVEAEGITLYAGTSTFRYHPGMGVNRIRSMRAGQGDWMVKAMGLRQGDAVLDATLGLGSDLLVASYAVGVKGRAVGLESERLVAVVVGEGMRTYRHELDVVNEALRRIDVRWADYRHYLFESAAPASFDVVYFDPMFAEPVLESQHMAPLRALGNSAPLERACLDRAAMVARRRVVVKDRRDGPYHRSGWFDRVVGGPRSRICYCVLECASGARSVNV